jgi:hypothetical protein
MARKLPKWPDGFLAARAADGVPRHFHRSGHKCKSVVTFLPAGLHQAVPLRYEARTTS